MPSAFHEAALEAAEQIDEWNGEAFLLTPQAAPVAPSGLRDPNARPVPDAARVAIPFRGVFIARGAVMHARGRNLPEPMTTGVAAARSYVRDVAMSLPYRPQRGDVVTRADTAEQFRVADVLERQLGRLQLDLTEIR